jgi:hypothetical protein
MQSLVEELQKDALNQDVAVTELLQKCLVVAVKLEIQEFASWARQELDGYKNEEVPEYRVVYGQPQVKNPLRGYQPLFFDNPKLTERFSRMHFNQPVGKIEHELKRAQQKGSGEFYVLYPPAVEKKLMDSIEFPLQPFLNIGRSEFQKILDALRKIILEWTLKLESDGITGHGMTFSKEEKAKAQSITYNVKNLFHGIERSQIQIESVNSAQNLAVNQFDYSKLKELIQALKDSVEELGLEDGAIAELMAEIRTLESQAASPKPKAFIIRELLLSVKNILEGAAGSLIASGLLAQIGRFFGP